MDSFLKRSLFERGEIVEKKPYPVKKMEDNTYNRVIESASEKKNKYDRLVLKVWENIPKGVENLSIDLRKKFLDLGRKNNKIEELTNNLEITLKKGHFASDDKDKDNKKINELENELRVTKERLQKSEREENIYHEEFYKIWDEIDKIMQEYDTLIKELEDEVTKVITAQVGGNNNEEYWKQKYLKYKAKYLKLKSL